MQDTSAAYCLAVEPAADGGCWRATEQKTGLRHHVLNNSASKELLYREVNLASPNQRRRIQDTGSFSTYCASEARWDHAAKIRSHCGFREFSEPQVQFRLNRWLYALCWTGTDRPSVLFDRAIAWLLTHKVLLPGATVLERCVARVRSRTQERVWGQLTRQISEATKTKLENLLVVPEDGHRSLLDRLRLDTDKLIPNKRFVKKQQMQWTLRGAHLLLQTRTKVLNEDLDEVFRHWYPKFRPQPQTQEPELKAA